MSAETVIGLADQLAVEPSFAAARFVSCNQKDGVALRSKAKATLHSPSAALNRSSFIFA
jgi:hypothetical protein